MKLSIMFALTSVSCYIATATFLIGSLYTDNVWHFVLGLCCACLSLGFGVVARDLHRDGN